MTNRCLYILLAFSTSAFAENMNQLIENRDISIGVKETKILSQLNGNYDVDLKSSPEVISSRGLSKIGGGTAINKTYQLEVARKKDSRIERFTEAIVKDFANHRDAKIKSSHFDDKSLLLSNTNCESNARTGYGMFEFTSKQKTHCVTLTKAFCDKLKVETEQSDKRLQVDRAKAFECEGLGHSTTVILNNMKKFAVENEAYGKEAKGEKLAIQAVADHSMRKLERELTFFAEWDNKSAADTLEQKQLNMMTGLLALAEFENMSLRCEKLQPFFASAAAATPTPEPTTVK